MGLCGRQPPSRKSRFVKGAGVKLHTFLQGSGGGGHPDTPLCPNAVRGDVVLDRLADSLHPRLQQAERRRRPRDSEWHLLSHGHPGPGAFPTALPYVWF